MQRDVFQGIADSTRREIIDLLANKAMPVNDIAEQFEISRPAVSRHIKILSECGLIVIHKEGRKRFCHINPEKIQEVLEWAARYRKFWAEKLDTLEAFLDEEDKKKQKK